MGNKAKRKSEMKQEYQEMQLKKRYGIIKIIVTIAIFVVFVIVRFYLNVSETIPLSDFTFNLFTLVVTFIACFLAGTGSNDIAKANRRMKEIERGQYKPGPTEKW